MDECEGAPRVRSAPRVGSRRSSRMGCEGDPYHRYRKVSEAIQKSGYGRIGSYNSGCPRLSQSERAAKPPILLVLSA